MVFDHEFRGKESSSSPFKDINNTTVDDSMNDFNTLEESQNRAKTSHVKLELDLYFNEYILPRSTSFDILMWWKLNGVTYPKQQIIANDVLIIPISSVAY